MANPNRSVYLAKKPRSLTLVSEESFPSRHEAEAFSAANKGDMVSRVSPYKTGPRNRPVTNFMVRFYSKVQA